MNGNKLTKLLTELRATISELSLAESQPLYPPIAGVPIIKDTFLKNREQQDAEELFQILLSALDEDIRRLQKQQQAEQDKNGGQSSQEGGQPQDSATNSEANRNTTQPSEIPEVAEQIQNFLVCQDKFAVFSFALPPRGKGKGKDKDIKKQSGLNGVLNGYHHHHHHHHYHVNGFANGELSSAFKFMVTNVNGVANGSTYADSKEGKVKENVEEEEEKEKEEERVPSRGKNGINLQIKNKQRKQALRPADEGSVTFRTVSSILKLPPGLEGWLRKPRCSPFTGVLASVLRCCSKFHMFKSMDQSAFNDLSLSIDRREKKCKLETCLRDFTNPEMVREVYCDDCKRKGEALKRLSILRPPLALCLHLRRLVGTRDGLEKVYTSVEFPLTLDLTPFCGVPDLPPSPSPPLSAPASGASSTSPFASPLLYELVAVIEHHGNATSGHYTTYRRAFKKAFNSKGAGDYDNHLKEGKLESSSSWFRISDESCQPVSEERVLASCAYMLFYERKNKLAGASAPGSAPARRPPSL